MRLHPLLLALFAVLALAGPARAADRDEAMPRYQHVFVIIEENKDYAQILDPRLAPNIARLAKAYGNATQFFGEVHPSEANYVALLGGDTFGIHDDDAFYCKPGLSDPFCPGSNEEGYVNHTVSKPNLGDQLLKANLTWKGYYESLPKAGALDVVASDPAFNDPGGRAALYASKHSGFLNFASVQHDPARGQRLVGFDALKADIAAERLPNFALIIPNQCNEMHGLPQATLPADCRSSNVRGLIARGDKVIGDLVAKLQSTKAWASDDNMAIVITFDEGFTGARNGCCAVTPSAISNFGGGHIPTVVITNHGPRGVEDATPYNHYSLLRTIEDAFRLPEHLGHAADESKGVVAMTPLFAEAKPKDILPVAATSAP